ncbi:hypothetical protein DIPPA_05392 [Diplonema papillatum]|nr:hypothetical protein DIPPA_05392 [Diplonema papillatum]
MPKKIYNSASQYHLRHHVWRPGEEHIVGGADPKAGMNGRPVFKWLHAPSPWVRGRQWKTMRSITGGTGKTATYVPLVVEKKPVTYTVQTVDFLQLPKKSFFEAIQRKEFRRTDREHQAVCMLPESKRIEPADLALQPVLRTQSSYSTHFKEVPNTYNRHGYRGGRGFPDRNTITSLFDSDLPAADNLDTLRSALRSQPRMALRPVDSHADDTGFLATLKANAS